MSWSEMPVLAKGAADASVRICKRGGRPVLNITLRRKINAAAKWAAATPIRVLLGFGGSHGRIRLEADPNGPHRCREYKGGSVTVTLPLPDGWRDETTRALGAGASLLESDPAIVEVVLPPALLPAGHGNGPPCEARNVPSAKRESPDVIATPRRAGDPEIGRKGGAKAKADYLPPPGWRPGQGTKDVTGDLMGDPPGAAENGEGRKGRGGA